MRSIVVVTIFVATFIVVFGEKARFDNYRVYSVNIENEEQLSVLRELEAYADGISFRAMPTAVGQMVDIIVPPHKLADISELFDVHEFNSQIRTKDLQKILDEEQHKMSESTKAGYGWKQYYNLSDIYDWLDQMLDKYPHLLTHYNYGNSYEGRPLRAIKVSHEKGNPTIFLESTIHPDEWITVATATYFMNELVTSNKTQMRYLADNFDWVIVPITNVDGYDYTHTTNRMWRKSRKPNPTRPQCVGADLNRNFDSHHAEAGASKDPCSEYFAGSKPFSESETLGLSELVKSFDVKLYMSFHSHGQFLCFPPGYAKNHVKNHDDLLRIALKTRTAILKRYKTNYAVGPLSTTIYLASGNSVDWAYDHLNIPLTYTFELRGPFPEGNIVPNDQIIPNALEVIDGIEAMVKEAKALNYL